MALRQRLLLALPICAWVMTVPARAEAQSAPPTPTIDELEPIIVTARKREEELQRTPVSVVSLNAAELEARSITNLQTLQNFVPNLTMSAAQNVGDSAGNIFIRGIGQEDFLAGAEPGVALYLDGIYVSRTMGTLIDLLDIDRIEVLRGPQGTLYGKNAIGGAINIISAQPGSETAAYADLIAGNMGRLDFRGMVNAPLTDRLSVRLTGGWMSRDGYVQRIAAPFPPTEFTETDLRSEGRKDSAAGRLQLRWRKSASMTIALTADVSRRRGTQSATHVDAIDERFGILPLVNALIREGTLPGPEITNELVRESWLESFAGGGNSVSQNVKGGALTLTKELDGHSLKLIAGYRNLRSHVTTDLDGSWFTILGNDFRERHRQFSGELQANGSLERLTYTGGLFGLYEKTHSSSGRGFGRLDVLYLCGCFYPPENQPVLFYTDRNMTSGSFAGYFQGDLQLAPRLAVTFGGRLSHEWKKMDAELLQLDPETLEPTGVALRSGNSKGDWTSFTWRGGIEFQATPQLMIYASAAKGYKSGGFNGRPVINLPNLGLKEYDPEKAVTYEAGIRSEWFDRLRLNASLFHTSYRDIQLRQQNFIGGIVTTLVENAAKARIRGIEVEAMAKLGKALTANFAYGYLNPEYLDVGRVPNLTLDTKFQRTPKHSFAASLDYSHPIGPNLIEAHVDYSYRAHEQFQLLPSPFDQNGYGLFGARLGLRHSANRWSIALFGTNLTDKRYKAAGRGTGLQEVGFATSAIAPPRQVGVELRAGF